VKQTIIVTLLPPPFELHRATLSDKDGRFILGRLEPGSVTAVVDHPGFERVARDLEAPCEDVEIGPTLHGRSPPGPFRASPHSSQAPHDLD